MSILDMKVNDRAQTPLRRMGASDTGEQGGLVGLQGRWRDLGPSRKGQSICHLPAANWEKVAGVAGVEKFSRQPGNLIYELLLIKNA